MDKTDGINKSSERHAEEPPVTVYCKLFSDSITIHLCDLRRQELNARGIFSCEGCGAMKNYDGNSSSAGI
jgi:hypothetical protein